MESLDLSQFDVRHRAQEGADMPLLDPLGRRTAVFIRVRGIDSVEYNDMFKHQIRRWVDRAPRKPTQEERDAEFWELLATLVAGWYVERDGQKLPVALKFAADDEPLEYSPANAARVLERHAWVSEQVRRFSDLRANFLPGLASS